MGMEAVKLQIGKISPKVKGKAYVGALGRALSPANLNKRPGAQPIKNKKV